MNTQSVRRSHCKSHRGIVSAGSGVLLAQGRNIAELGQFDGGAAAAFSMRWTL